MVALQVLILNPKTKEKAANKKKYQRPYADARCSKEAEIQLLQQADATVIKGKEIDTFHSIRAQTINHWLIYFTSLPYIANYCSLQFIGKLHFHNAFELMSILIYSCILPVVKIRMKYVVFLFV